MPVWLSDALIIVGFLALFALPIVLGLIFGGMKSSKRIPGPVVLSIEDLRPHFGVYRTGWQGALAGGLIGALPIFTLGSAVATAWGANHHEAKAAGALGVILWLIPVYLYAQSKVTIGPHRIEHVSGFRLPSYSISLAEVDDFVFAIWHRYPRLLAMTKSGMTRRVPLYGGLRKRVWQIVWEKAGMALESRLGL